MLDCFNRRIHYLRISVTDRCNLRCEYCMPEDGVPLVDHASILSFEKICEITRTAVSMGIDKIRVTGGEPLVRRNIVELVKMLSEIDGIEDLSMTTNGSRLAEFAEPLAKAGLKRINISLDAINPERYKQITRVGDVNDVLAGVRAAMTAGMNPIKLNCVITESLDEPDAADVARFAEENGLQVRFIRRMDMAVGEFWPIVGGIGGDCAQCNRLRLSSRGMLYPCLFSEMSFDVRKLGAAEAIKQAVQAKPEAGDRNSAGRFYNVGG